MRYTYSNHSPDIQHLQGGILYPHSIEQVTFTDEDGTERQQYRYNLLKFDEDPTQEQIDKYLSIYVDVQQISDKRNDWLERLPKKALSKESLAALTQGGVLKAGLTDKEWDQVLLAFDKWEDIEAGAEIAVDSVLSYKDIVYTTLQTHDKQLDWTPDTATSLFTKAVPEGVIEEWEQPEGSHDAYMKGDKVTFEGHIWESTIDDNVWSPTDYPQGWDDLGEA